MVYIMLQLQTCLCTCKTGRMSANIGCLVARCACWPLGSDTHVPTNSGAPKHATWLYASYTNPTHLHPHSERTRHITTITATDNMRTDSRSAHRVQRGSHQLTPIRVCACFSQRPAANNYMSTATSDDGSCHYSVRGCTTSAGNYNYNPNADVDDDSCIPLVSAARSKLPRAPHRALLKHTPPKLYVR